MFARNKKTPQPNNQRRRRDSQCAGSRAEGVQRRATVFYRRCVVVVTQAEADFRFGLSPQGAQAQGEADRPLAQAEGEGGAVASASGETETFATPFSSI